MGDLIDSVRPRRKRRVMMHVNDAGYANGLIAVFRCRQCGHQTDWMTSGSITEAKRGEPCPKCNVTLPAGSGG